MLKTTFAIIVAAGLTLAPAQLLAQGAGGSPLPPRPGDRAAPSGGAGGSALPTQSGQRYAPSSGGNFSAAPVLPGSTTGNAGNTNSAQGR
ncbi:hypothetical protein JQ616_03060 [Bradyrhizobium tropiciagri]|uniref:hypothetical protein n=1 Tax=Bradyrhizobium tropiciagri TaxID=312253 RepID=UPI001BADF23F|nr:hypothetical protein [Bradyrhizobium tropiciagri]MBR0893915.1 hypothetical protein [Bradyrhizobium tropiciagri]